MMDKTWKYFDRRETKSSAKLNLRTVVALCISIKKLCSTVFHMAN